MTGLLLGKGEGFGFEQNLASHSFVLLHNLRVTGSFDSLTLKSEQGDILVDFSKNLITEDVMKLLIDLVS